MGSITSARNKHPEKCKGLGGGYGLRYRIHCAHSHVTGRGCKEVHLSPSRIAAQWTKKLPVFSSLGFRGKKTSVLCGIERQAWKHLEWTGKQNSRYSARRQQVPKEHHSPSAGPSVKQVTPWGSQASPPRWGWHLGSEKKPASSG